MEGLQTIIRAAHCRSTHHLFAIDALGHVRSDAGRQLARLLLRYHGRYLSGACDPDVRFRDFQNHVVHVADGNWGGAPQAAVRWYQRLQELLQRRSWGEAAHAAGVLSHYFTDPLQPLHTAYSDREAVVHRPLEWSVFEEYDSILARWRDDSFRIVFQLSTRSDWLPAAVLRGAELAHQSFETLVDTYDLEAGRHDPRKGLSEASLEALAELCSIAVVGWARVLERTADEVTVPLPVVSLGWSTIWAAARMPVGWLARRKHSRREREAILEGLAHYHRTGEIGPHAADDVRLLRKVIAVRQREQKIVAALRPPATDEPPLAHTALRVVSAPAAATPSTTPSDAPTDDAIQHEPLPQVAQRPLTPASPITAASAIGPHTAARLQAIQITTIHHLLAVCPEELVRRLQSRWPAHTRWITVEAVAGWQSQTRLRMALPQLTARDVRMLVAAGYRSPATLAAATAEELADKLLRHSRTPQGKLALRGTALPNLDELRRWIDAAGTGQSRAA